MMPIVRPRTLNDLAAGLGLNAIATGINAGWCAFLIRWGRRQRSPALVADGWHLLTDVFTSVGVLVGLGLATLTGWQFLDPAAGGAGRAQYSLGRVASGPRIGERLDG